MFTSTDFSFASTPNTTMGVIIADTSGGEKTAQFGISRKIDTEIIRGRAEPFFFGTIDEPLQFEITLSKTDDDEWTEDEKIKLAKWLFPRTYQNFISNDNSGIVYKCICQDKPSKILIGNLPRLFSLNFVCNAPWSHSTPVGYTVTTASTPIFNSSNVLDWDLFPEIEFLATGTTFSFKNHTRSEASIITGITVGDTVYINGQKRQIISSLGNYYLSTFNKVWPRLDPNLNNVQILAGADSCSIAVEYPIAI